MNRYKVSTFGQSSFNKSPLFLVAAQNLVVFLSLKTVLNAFHHASFQLRLFLIIFRKQLFLGFANLILSIWRSNRI